MAKKEKIDFSDNPELTAKDLKRMRRVTPAQHKKFSTALDAQFGKDRPRLKPGIVDYEKGHLEDLRDPKEAELYLNAALEEADPRVFVRALGEVVKAKGAKGTSLNRRLLHAMLSAKGNPELVNLHRILRIAGFKLHINALEVLGA